MKVPSLMIRWKKHDDPLKQHYLSIGPYPYCISDKEGTIKELTLEEFISKVEIRPWSIEYHKMLLDNIPVRLKHLGDGEEGWFEAAPSKATGLTFRIEGDKGFYSLLYGKSFEIKILKDIKISGKFDSFEASIDYLNKNINLDNPIPKELKDFGQVIEFLTNQ